MNKRSRTIEGLQATLLDVLTEHADVAENDMYRAFGEAIRALREQRAVGTTGAPPPEPARRVPRPESPESPAAAVFVPSAASSAAPSTAASAAPSTATNPSPALRPVPAAVSSTAPPTPGGTRVAAHSHDDGWLVVVEILGQKAFLDFGQQLHRSGVYLTLDPSPPLNAVVDLCVLLPASDDEVWFEGRVVFVSAGGTAFDLKPAQADHPQRWNRASAAYASQPVLTPTAPLGAPRTQSPRLARKAAPTRSAAPRPASSRPTRSTSPGSAAPASRPVRPTRPTSAPSHTRGGVSGPSPPSTRSGPVSDSAGAGQLPDPPSRPGVRGSRPTVPRVPASRPVGRVEQPAPAPPVAPVATPGRPPVPRGLRIPPLPKLLQTLQSTCARAVGADHYALLSLHWSSYGTLIDGAYAHEKALVDPAHFPDTLTEAQLDARQQVDAALDAAYNVLRDPATRREYRERIVDRMNLESAVGLYWEKADTAMLRNDDEAALEYVQRVLELSPRHAEARARLALLHKR